MKEGSGKETGLPRLWCEDVCRPSVGLKEKKLLLGERPL